MPRVTRLSRMSGVHPIVSSTFMYGRRLRSTVWASREGEVECVMDVGFGVAGAWKSEGGERGSPALIDRVYLTRSRTVGGPPFSSLAVRIISFLSEDRIPGQRRRIRVTKEHGKEDRHG